MMSMEDTIQNKLQIQQTLKENMPSLKNIAQYKNDPFKLIDDGYEFLDLENYQLAFELFSFGAAIDNTDCELLNGLGISLCELGRLEEAKIILERAIRLCPDDAITYANLAGVYWEIENHDMAIHYYHKSIEYDPNIEETYYNLINLYIETGALYMAFIFCLDFLQRFPGSGEATELLSDIILNLGISLY
ncbi:MAG: hypothetical protein CVV44_07405 [Spirochaetae bacterium HGW-Spirochaetae-1]|nr:MAG: hypothetical protein CVV44_07405 [Spirochaetae bacterium HGW-Spirochaetae-1]